MTGGSAAFCRRAEREGPSARPRPPAPFPPPGQANRLLLRCLRDTELFIVEGDIAGGSAKQARHRKTQAILPLRGKILNVAYATAEKIRANQQLSDLMLALGCDTRDKFNEAPLRYEKKVIMTDADVDGAQIAILLITFFFRELPELVRHGHLFLALPPLFRMTSRPQGP